MLKVGIMLALLMATASVAAVNPMRGTGSNTQTVVLKKRADNGPYGDSAYSFRYRTQDVAIHRNAVDLVFNGCGLLHVSPEKGLKNRIAKVAGSTFGDIKGFPTEGWMSDSIAPERGGLYVMEIDDGTTHMRVMFQITGFNGFTVELEWAPFAEQHAGLGGTLGQCTGHHDCK